MRYELFLYTTQKCYKRLKRSVEIILVYTESKLNKTNDIFTKVSFHKFPKIYKGLL